MLKRRHFLQQTGALALGSLFLSKNAAAFGKPSAVRPLGVQLFTFFNVIDDDVKGTLQKIADVGYKEIESAFSKKGGYYGMKPKEFSAMLTGMGLSWQSHHVLGAPFKMPPGAKMPAGPDGKPMVIPPMKNLQDNMQELVDSVAEGGVPYLVCANIPTNTLADIKSSINILNKTGEACNKAGITFAYHNHDAEFHTIEGAVPYDMFLKELDADKVKMELDLAWATKGGKDPVELFKQNPGRFPLWHVKDLDASRENILPVGSGTIDYKRIFDNASVAGMKHCFIEHDMPKDPMESIKSSYAYLSKMLA